MAKAVAETAEEAQTKMNENVLDNADLLGLLRQEAEVKAGLAEIRAKAREAEKAPAEALEEAGTAVDTFLKGLDLTRETTYRCGQFTIKLTTKGGTKVGFTTKSKDVFQRSLIASD